MSDLHEAAMSALAHDIRAEQIQSAERRDFNDALAAMVRARDKAFAEGVQALAAAIERAAEQLNRETK